MSDKELFKIFSETYQLPLFHTYDWWNECFETWDVVHIRMDHYQLLFPYIPEKKWGFKLIRNPHLTPYSGFIFTPNTPLEIQEALISELLVNKFPRFDYLDIDFAIGMEMKMYSKLLKTRNKVTHLLTLSTPETIFNNFKPALQRQIRKAQRNKLFIQESDSVDQFYELYKKTFQKQQLKVPIKKEQIAKQFDVLKRLNRGKILLVFDEEKNAHAAMVLAFDHEFAYYLLGGTNHQFNGSGAMSLLLWHAIQLSTEMNLKQFDFEGSMIPNVSRYFKNFSANEVHYINVHVINSRLMGLLKGVKDRLQ